MQKFVRPQELINYKIKKAIINLSRFAMPILAIAVNKLSPLSQLHLELSFWGPQAAENDVLSMLTIRVSPVKCDLPNGEPIWIFKITLEY